MLSHFKKLYLSYDHPQVIAGQGTIGMEILQQVPDVDAIIVPCGGGGLLAGVALAVKKLKPNVKIIVNININNLTQISKVLNFTKE